MKQNYIVIRNTYNKETDELVNMQIVNRIELDEEELQQYVSLIKVCNNIRTGEYFNEEYKKYFILPDPKETKEFAQFDTVNILFKDIDLKYLDLKDEDLINSLDPIICDTEITKLIMRNICYEKDEDIDKYMKGFGYFCNKPEKDPSIFKFNTPENNTFKTHVWFFNVKIKEIFKKFNYNQFIYKMKLLCDYHILKVLDDYNDDLERLMKTDISRQIEDTVNFYNMEVK